MSSPYLPKYSRKTLDFTPFKQDIVSPFTSSI